MADSKTTPLLILISAPSGAGKTTVSERLRAATPGMERVVTCTTRAPRTGERQGVDYHFLGRDDFERRVAGGEFLEHAEVYGNRYGTLRVSVVDRLKAGVDVILTMDVQGAETIRQMADADDALREALVTVFLMPPSLAELERRLRGREKDSEEVVARRLAVARAEMEQWRQFRYVVVSGSREDDLEAMLRIVFVERLRSDRRRGLAVT